MDDLVKKYPKNTFAHLGLLELGLMRLRMNEATKADSLFSVVENLYPDSISAAQAIFEKSAIAYARGDTGAALRGLEKLQQSSQPQNLVIKAHIEWQCIGEFGGNLIAHVSIFRNWH